MAAIAARQAGAAVTVIGKTAPGKGTSTTLSVGSFAGPWGGQSVETYTKRTLTAGRGLNDTAMIAVVAAEAPDRFRDLVDWGMHSKSAPGYFMAQPDDPDSELMPVWGREIVRCLVAKAGELGVEFVSGLTLRALRADARGAVLSGYSARRGEWLELKAGAVVLAAGGAGGLYLHHDNPQRITGDAYALAYQAGAVLQDMEFVQFYPICIAEPDKPPFLMSPEGADLGRIVGADGTDILDKYGITVRPAGTHARDRLSQALFQEIGQGRDVYLDLTGVAKDDFCADPISETKWTFLGKRYDAWNRPLRIAPMAHFTGGGACTDLSGATSVEGLFAAGEAVGGAHGANRMGGNSLTECIVFGHRAGRAAADWAAGRDRGQAAEFDEMKPVATAGQPNGTAEELKRQLKTVMWRRGGIERDQAGLEDGIVEVGAVAAEAAKTDGINEPRQFERLLEVQLGALAGRLILEAALRRQESRGGHLRTDFPGVDDDNWRGHLKVVNRNGEPKWWFEALDPVATAPERAAE